MQPKSFHSEPFDRLDPRPGEDCTTWIWHGYLARGNITLLTSRWKAGKTTLVAGLLQRLSEGGTLLGHECQPGRALIISEEPRENWAARRKLFAIGPQAKLMSRPFITRPKPREWFELIMHLVRMRKENLLDVLVVDPLASFLPGSSDSDPATLLRLLQPLQYLAARGVAVLVLHHPRKKSSEIGSSARGSGALLGFVDIILELHRFGRSETDSSRRKLIALSRHTATPRRLAYEWNEFNGEFTRLDALESLRFRENWEQVCQVLAQRKQPVTRRELLDEWPPDQHKPSGRTLWGWLSRAIAENLVVRTGSGSWTDPYRYGLREEIEE